MTGLADLAGVLDHLCPMHVLLDENGEIHHAGPTLLKLSPDSDLKGRGFFEAIELMRPRSVTTMPGLLDAAGQKLKLRLRAAPATGLKGGLQYFGPGKGILLNLSFGISLLDAVRDYGLSGSDFAPTDLAIELLYLVEAKSAAMAASRTLNQRLQGAMIAAEERAYTDTLTGLHNRRALDHVLARLTDGGASFALMHLDLDFFKAVNDTYGHAAGDHVLKEVARIMREETREKDTIARVGGDEFVLIFEGLKSRSVLERIAGRLIAHLEEPIRFEGKTCKVSASIGLVLADHIRNDPAGLVAKADEALYAAKRAGRGCHRFYDDLAVS